jgi:hypothetical protein
MRALRDFLLAPAAEPAHRAPAAASSGARSDRGRRGAALDLRALRDFLLAPPATSAADSDGAEAPAAPAAASASAAPAAVAVLCAAGDARALGVATATLLARRHRMPCAVACVWTAAAAELPPASSRPPAGRASRRLAAALAGRGLDAMACGRVAVVTLPADAESARAAAGRAFAAAGAAPTVLVLGGPRDDAFDALLADCDRVLVLARAGGDAALASLAVAGLGPVAGRAATATVTFGPVARALAAAGLAVPPALRGALAGTREGGR